MTVRTTQYMCFANERQATGTTVEDEVEASQMLPWMHDVFGSRQLDEPDRHAHERTLTSISTGMNSCPGKGTLEDDRAGMTRLHQSRATSMRRATSRTYRVSSMTSRVSP